MRPSEIQHLLAERRIVLTKSLGQNFLHDANQLRRIIQLAELRRADRVLEIGPGLGPLTELLLENAGEVLAIEKDARLVQVLTERLGSRPASVDVPKAKLRLVHDDALEYLRRDPLDWSAWKLVANLPYSVASPILVELACSAAGPERLVATLQLEVSKRLMARPGQADYGVLTLLVQLAYQPMDWFKIPAACFFPAPDVDSACVALRRREHPLLPPSLRVGFAAIVKRSFSQRRKMMAKLLKTDWPAANLEQAFSEIPLSLQTRAETVSLDQFVALTRSLYERRNL